MTTYSALSINISFGELFVSGIWNGNKDSNIVAEGWSEDEITRYTVKPPLIMDGISREDEMGVRDCAHQARLLSLTARARNTVIDGSYGWHHRMVDVAQQYELDKAYDYATIQGELSQAVAETIEAANARTIKNLKKVKQAPVIGIPIDTVSNAIQAIDDYYEELQKRKAENMKMSMGEYINTIKEPVEPLPEAYKKLKEALTTHIKPAAVANEEGEDDDDTTIEEPERKPASKLNANEEERPNPSRTPLEFPDSPLVQSLGDAIPSFRPTNEQPALQALADKIMSSEFGKLKDVRKLREPFEIILSFAIYLMAMIGQITTSNSTSTKESKLKGDWFHIREQHRMGFIRAFYAAFNNYNQIVKRGLPYRKDYTENGLIAVMTLIMSTAVGTSDEMFMKAFDEIGWETTIYPFISGRRRIALAEHDVKQVINNGKLFRSPEGNGVFSPSILDFYHHTKSLHHIRAKTPKVSMNKIKVTRDSSEDEGPKAVTMDYYEWSSDINRKGTEEASTTQDDTVIDIDATAARSLRQRKSPPPNKQPTKEQPINRTFPLPVTPKKTIVGSKRARSQKTVSKRNPSKTNTPVSQRKPPLIQPPLIPAQRIPASELEASMETDDENDPIYNNIMEDKEPPKDDRPYLFTVDSQLQPIDYEQLEPSTENVVEQTEEPKPDTTTNPDEETSVSSKKSKKSV
jgi:hypothetical protein